MAEDIGCYSLIMVGQQLLQMKIYDDSLPGGKTEWPTRLINRVSQQSLLVYIYGWPHNMKATSLMYVYI